MSQTTSLTPTEARNILWRKGNLTFKLHQTQKEIYQFIGENKNRKIVIASSRRLGKSFLLCVMAVEQCIQKPNSIVKFIAPEKSQIRSILRPIMRDVLKGCPGDLRPEYKTNENLYRFPNGSEIQLAGSDNGNAENLRGGNSHLCIIDEAGFCSDLEYVIQSILLPTTTTTKGKVIMASTPPKSPDHEFVNFVKEAKIKGALITKTIFDNPLITQDDINEMVEASGGVDTIQFRREYMAEIIKDDNFAVIPEFTKEMAERTVREWQRPPYFDCYTAMDIGFKDLTVVLFAYLDFRSAKLVIEDELVMSGKKMTTDILAAEIKKKEEAVWKNALTGESQKPFIRVSDNNLIVLNDLQNLHNLTFLPTNKDNADAALNFLRMLIGQEKIIINPRCTTMVFHLENAVWNKQRTSFERSADAGHYDAIDALKYLVRNVNFNKNPYPSNWGMPNKESIFQKVKSIDQRNLHDNIKQWFKPNKR